MSGNWDDTDSDDNVEVVENPVIIPRARQPSIAKSLEKAGVQILENPIEGSEHNGEEDSDDSMSVGSNAESEDYVDHSGEVITLDFLDPAVNMKKTANIARNDQTICNNRPRLLERTKRWFPSENRWKPDFRKAYQNEIPDIIAQFPCLQRNIVSEFADTEIFIISLDSLIIECLEHKYHDWTLAGQTIALSTQLDRFLNQFVVLGGRFKLVVFTDLSTRFSQDTTLAFARASAIAHLSSGPFERDIEYFHSPLDTRWADFLTQITPSFFMISIDNISAEVCGKDEINVSPQLETAVIHALSHAVPIVPLYEIKVNFADVTAFFVEPKLVNMINWEQHCAAHWECNSELLRQSSTPSVDISSIASPAHLWAKIIAEAKSMGDLSDQFDTLACAVLLSSIMCTKRGPSRVYLPPREGGKRGLDLIRDRRALLQAAVAHCEKINWKTCNFSMSDFWDGRMVVSLFDEISSNGNVLPYRVQEEFSVVHGEAHLNKSLAVDTDDRLFDSPDESCSPLSTLPILYEVQSDLLSKFIPELKDLSSENTQKEGTKQDYADFYRTSMAWKFKTVEEEYTKPPEKIENEWQLKRANKQKQLQSRWYEMFANSLEGRGSNLLVDFSRTPRGYVVAESEKKEEKKGGKGGWGGQKGGGGGKAPAAKSKKEAILEANKNAKSAKIIEGERTKIKFAIQQGKNAIVALESLVSSLELPETKAFCEFETTVRIGRDMMDSFTGKDKLEARKVAAVRLVGLLKNCLTKHWKHLDDKQKAQVVDLWVSLGFEAPEGSKPSAEAKAKKLDLDSNMVYYQMEYAGELIDIQSDPQKDDRVTGFAPDGWQRRMLDAVDLGNSALIIAPTSAGKTFVSYYCIEKVLRGSDEDVVVYVSPSKALTNQVCGSIYARFRNKPIGRGKSLFGTLTNDYGTNTLNCQVLVTIPESLEELLLSTNPVVQAFTSRIKYVIFDEVHSIGASEEAPIWEHLLLIIRCPFIALSATIGNANKLHDWLNRGEAIKSGGKRKVDLIHYGERYSELELAIQKIEKPEPVADVKENGDADKENDKKERKIAKSTDDCIQQFMPYGVFTTEKIRMFGIPEDQQLTSRQVLQLYKMMSSEDPSMKTKLEPCIFFGYKAGHPVWLSRTGLRKMETELKQTLLKWLNDDEAKMRSVLGNLGQPVQTQLHYRSAPFNKLAVASENIIPLIDNMREKAMLPAICFNDDRFVCEELAVVLCEELEARQKEFEESPEFKTKFALKDEEKLMKLAKRKRDAKEKKGGKQQEEGVEREQEQEVDEGDPLALQKSKMKAALSKFKLHGKVYDDDVYDKIVERLTRTGKGKESTKLLLRLFERGIGYHHAGLNNYERGAVEILFRSGHLALLFSTSTLALGMNMPCKTVIFGVDTAHLTPLLFRQMSGRAGRRGFDHKGTVVFMSVPTSKIRRLLTASLSTLHGNPPFTTSYLLRLLAYVHQQNSVHPDERSGAVISTVEQRAEAAATLLSHSFSLFTRREARDGSLQKQLRLFTAFSVQLLRHLQLLDKSCRAKGLWQVAVALQGGEPGNLILVHLIHNGVLHSYCKRYQGEELKRRMLKLLATLFTRDRLPPSFRPEDKSSYPSGTNCDIFLEPLPKDVRAHVDKYNETVLGLYRQFLAASSPSGRILDSRLVVSGKDDSSISLFPEYLISPLFDGYSSDASFLPTLNLDETDHRGRKLWFNAYAYDFWIHESRKKLEAVNKLQTATMWFQVSHFLSVLTRLSETLQVVARPQDPVAELMKQLAHEYDVKFRTAFGMKVRM